MDNKTKLRLGGLALLATAVLSLILVLFTDSWPVAILLAISIMSGVIGGLIWSSRRQQRQFLERLKKFDIDPEKGRVNEANLRRMYHSGGQAQKDVITIICMSQNCSVDEAHEMMKKRPTRQQMNQMAQQQMKGQRRPHR
ncbi:LapA family protein [Neisseria animaloris]|uniref:Membrane protein n=1 Tax=Neisseria animaloris TaxID=326522 RepID=A0A3S4YAQ8_9NEIS|nr:LapA family protein [Neisseria animaloris]VEJ21401.1 membrane protein [Neisseria animaloris]